MADRYLCLNPKEEIENNLGLFWNWTIKYRPTVRYLYYTVD